MVMLHLKKKIYELSSRVCAFFVFLYELPNEFRYIVMILI